jgi:hypothetical protein
MSVVSTSAAVSGFGRCHCSCRRVWAKWSLSTRGV